jgi:phosphocarrier protein HPr
MSDETEVTVVVTNKKGLHARAAAKFVRIASQYNAKVMVAKIAGAGVSEKTSPAESSGGSILGLMMLGAECGSTIRLRGEGEQAAEATAGLKKLVEGRFDEE